MELIHDRGKGGQWRGFPASHTYRLARWYCFTCGFAVVPLKVQSKERLFKGNHFQTWFPCDEHLRKWFCTRQPYGLAIVPGEVSGNLVVIDFDELAIYQIWSALVPGATDLPCVRSARGVHVYVRLQTLPTNNSWCNGQFEGVPFGQIIVRGAIAAPPSIHPSGHVYRWIGNPAAVPLFSCLADLGVEPVPEKTHLEKLQPLPKNFVRPADGIRHPAAYVRSALQGEQQRLRTLPEGQRNAGLYRAALKLAKYLNVLSEGELQTELETVARQMGLESREIVSTIRSGLRRGVANGVLTI